MRRCTRTYPLPPGEVRHEAHGQCHTCYGRRWWQTHQRVKSRGTRLCGRPLKAALFVDAVAVERAVAGDVTPLNAAELRVVIAELTRRGFSTPETARRAGCTERTVTRHRARLRGD